MITIYAEKPDVARKIAAAIGPIVLSDGTKVIYDKLATYEKRIKGEFSKQGYIPIKWKGKDTNVTWGYGHLCGLFELSDYDEDFKHWKNIPLPYIPSRYKIKIQPNTKAQFNIVKKLFNSSELIINATDWDREGEVIFAYSYEASGCKKPFKRAYYVSQNEQAFNEAFDKLTPSSEVYNIEQAGRCRGIADWLVGMNLTVAATLKANSSVLSIGRVQTPTLAMVVDREKKIRNFKSEKYFVPQAVFKTSKGEEYKGDYADSKRISDKSEAEAIIKKLTGKAKVISAEKKDKKVSSPPLYSLGTIQMEANSKFGFSAARTLEIVQSLYELGVVTYPRTNSAYLPEDYKPQAEKALKAISAIPAYASLIKGRPIKFNNKYFDDKKVESHFAIVPTHVTPKSLNSDQEKLYDLICRSLIITIYPDAVVEDTKVVTEDNGVKFNSRGSTVKSAGWMEVTSQSKENLLPALSQNENINGKYELAEKQTEPPKRYTDKTLIAAMISADKDGDEKDIKSLAELNIAGIGTEATRAGIIENLLKRGYIERNKKSFAATEKGISLIDSLPVEDVKSASLTAQWENRLDEIARGKEKSEDFIKDIEKTVKKWCSQIDKEMSKASSNFTGNASPFASSNSTGLKCPVCGKDVIKFKWGYGCTGYKEGCKFGISENIAGKKLTEKQIKSLIEKGKTNKIKGFKSKAGKTFEAKLKLENGKVQFDFDN